MARNWITEVGGEPNIGSSEDSQTEGLSLTPSFPCQWTEELAGLGSSTVWASGQNPALKKAAL